MQRSDGGAVAAAAAAAAAAVVVIGVSVSNARAVASGCMRDVCVSSARQLRTSKRSVVILARDRVAVFAQSHVSGVGGVGGGQRAGTCDANAPRMRS